MERNFNIAEILKDKPKGTKLYADAFGELSIEEICTEDDNVITLSDNGGTDWLFYNDGKYRWRGESILVPSKEMRDWRKFKPEDFISLAYFDKGLGNRFLCQKCKDIALKDLGDKNIFSH